MRLLAPWKRRARHPNGSLGQSLAEFAIVFPILMLIIGGIIQFGLIFWGQNTLNQVVRDTGRWAATQQSCNSAIAKPPLVVTANNIAAASNLQGRPTASLPPRSRSPGVPSPARAVPAHGQHGRGLGDHHARA